MTRRTMMYERIKKNVYTHYVSIAICVIVVLACGIWLYADRTSDIDTTGVRNADIELRHAREYNQQSTDYNQRVRDAVESSQTLNERTEERINTSVELNTRAEDAIDRGAELTAKARADAIRAKAIIGQSRSILERAKERAKKSESTTTQQ